MYYIKFILLAKNINTSTVSIKKRNSGENENEIKNPKKDIINFNTNVNIITTSSSDNKNNSTSLNSSSIDDYNTFDFDNANILDVKQNQLKFLLKENNINDVIKTPTSIINIINKLKSLINYDDITIYISEQDNNTHLITEYILEFFLKIHCNINLKFACDIFLNSFNYLKNNKIFCQLASEINRIITLKNKKDHYYQEQILLGIILYSLQDVQTTYELENINTSLTNNTMENNTLLDNIFKFGLQKILNLYS